MAVPCAPRQLRPPPRASHVLVHAAKTKRVRKTSAPKPSSKVVLDNDRLYTDKDYVPARAVGPITLAKAAGSGRGVLATQVISPSEVVMCCEPIAMRTGAQGTELRPEHLVEELQGMKLSEADSHRLSLLYDGTPESTRQLVPLSQLVNAEEHVKKLAAKAKAKSAKKGFGGAAKKAAPAAAAAASRDADASTSAPDARMKLVTRYNAYGHVHRDLAASVTRGEPEEAFIGLWPEYSMLNHSCAPNVMPTLVGDRLVVRAVREIQKNGEVTVSYLQELAMSPVQQRRKYLQGAYGFKCTCYRCTLEEQQPLRIQERLQDIHNTIREPEWQARGRSAVNTKNTQALARVRADVMALTDALEEDMEAENVATEVRPWLRASAYAAYELAALCSDVGNEELPAAPRSLLPHHAIVSPASDSHLLLALETLLRAGAKAKDGKETEAAARECILAHGARYGTVSDAVLARIMDALGSVDHYMGRYNIANISARSPALDSEHHKADVADTVGAAVPTAGTTA